MLMGFYYFMKTIELEKVEHERKRGEICPYIEANVTEDCFLSYKGELIGFFLQSMPEKMCKLADLANAEFRSTRVPKSDMNRRMPKGKRPDGKYAYDTVVQTSVILGSIAPKVHMQRAYASISQVHSVASAQTFIKAMLALALESEELIKELMPEQYEKQLELFSAVKDKWKFGNLFTSSISNYNISAPFHQDNANIVDAVNVIICKRLNSKGGDLHVPDYNATFGQHDNSILVYPAWRNMHAVTPIIPTYKGGYRNSLVFYPLSGFDKHP